MEDQLAKYFSLPLDKLTDIAIWTWWWYGARTLALSFIANKHNPLWKTIKNYIINKGCLEFCREECSDGTAAKTRKHSGETPQIKKEHQKVNQHSASFVDKVLVQKKSVELNSMFSVTIKIIKMLMLKH